MLVLSGYPQDDIIIGDPNRPLGRVRIVEIEPCGRVRLGFDFPRDVPVNRASIAAAKAEEALARK